MDNWVIVLMWLSGWFYINGIRNRVEDLERKISQLTEKDQYGKQNSHRNNV